MANKKAVGTNYIPNYQPEQKGKKQNKCVKNRNKKKQSSWLVKITPAVLFIALGFVLCVSFVASNIWLNKLGHEITNLKEDIKEFEENNQKLKYKISTLSSLDRVEQDAIKMGMVYPQSFQYIFLEKSPENKINNSNDNKEINKPREEDKKTLLGSIQSYWGKNYGE